MQKIFINYRSVIINAIILLAFVTAIILDEGVVKDFVIGLGTGVALVSLGKSIANAKQKKRSLENITQQQ